MARLTRYGALLATLFIFAWTAAAQSSDGFDLSWFTVDSGGRTSTGGGYTINGTAGQPDAGTLSGGSYTLSGGFWPSVRVMTATATPTPTPTPTSLPTSGTTATATQDATATLTGSPTTGSMPTATDTATATRMPTATAAPTVAADLVVNTTDDTDDGTCNSAHCSLREAIDAANDRAGPDAIAFDIPGSDPACDGRGVCTIQPALMLPRLIDDGTTIDGYTQAGSSRGPAPVLRIVLDGHDNGSFSGLEVRGADNVIRGMVIQRFTPFSGIDILGAAARGNRVEGNFIGTDATGTLPRANCTLPVSCSAVWVWDGARDNIVGPDNLIAFNGQGVWVTGEGSVGNTVTRNRIHSNDGQGIVLYGGGNLDLAPPVIEIATTTRLTGTACSSCIVEVFSDDEDEGRSYEGATKADAAGRWALNLPVGAAGPNITATATDSGGNTSEFSLPTRVTRRREIFLPWAAKLGFLGFWQAWSGHREIDPGPTGNH